MIDNQVVRTRRRVAALLMLVVAFAAAAIIVAPKALADDASTAVGTTDSYVVAEGDTLWSIAQSLTPEDGDVRDTVATIKDMNLLESSAIGIGDQLVIPLAG